MTPEVTLIPGDGIGPEVSAATLRLLEAAGAKIKWLEMAATPVVGRRKGETEMNPLVEAIRKTRVALKGPIATPVGTGHRSINVALSDQQLAQRRAAMDALGDRAWKPAEARPRKVTPALKVYAKMVTSADKGAVRDLSRLD